MLCERCKQELGDEVETPGAVEDLDLTSLLSVSVDGHAHLPNRSGVYFAIAGERICYIGESGHMGTRWLHHPLLDRLRLENDARIAWVEIHDRALRRKFEKECIKRFRPLWNKGGSEHMRSGLREHVEAETLRRFAVAHTSHAFNAELHPYRLGWVTG